MRFSAVVAIISALSMTALAIPAPAPENLDIAEAAADLAARRAPVEPYADDFDGDLDDDDDDDDDVYRAKRSLEKRGWGCNIFGGNDGRCHRPSGVTGAAIASLAVFASATKLVSKLPARAHDESC
ncbi:hypothetical protein GX51_01021 [Blastomyces parvus]|uniref:Uncharacterized protein n=1 Tax=Blastomyces parvus TaxID=2060905 RepID=A0A2B7XBE0_9EURO|nr:hypothetical protein GX51_01021 [Blastomyces parvus]